MEGVLDCRAFGAPTPSKRNEDNWPAVVGSMRPRPIASAIFKGICNRGRGTRTSGPSLPRRAARRRRSSPSIEILFRAGDRNGLVGEGVGFDRCDEAGHHVVDMNWFDLRSTGPGKHGDRQGGQLFERGQERRLGTQNHRRTQNQEPKT